MSIVQTTNEELETSREEFKASNEERLRVVLSAASISVFNQDLELRFTCIQTRDPGLAAEPIIG